MKTTASPVCHKEISNKVNFLVISLKTPLQQNVSIRYQFKKIQRKNINVFNFQVISKPTSLSKLTLDIAERLSKKLFGARNARITLEENKKTRIKRRKIQSNELNRDSCQMAPGTFLGGNAWEETKAYAPIDFPTYDLASPIDSCLFVPLVCKCVL